MEVGQNRKQKSRKLGLNSPLCLSALPHLLVYLDTLIGNFQFSDYGESKTSDNFQEKELGEKLPPTPTPLVPTLESDIGPDSQKKGEKRVN